MNYYIFPLSVASISAAWTQSGTRWGTPPSRSGGGGRAEDGPLGRTAATGGEMERDRAERAAAADFTCREERRRGVRFVVPEGPLRSGPVNREEAGAGL